jgi:predicted DNA-binding ribbon-helix-helix protein
MKSPVQKRSVVIAGRKTSVSLEQAFWDGLKEIARLRSGTLAQQLGEIATGRAEGNLSSAIRLYVLDHYRSGAERFVQRDAAEARHPGASQAARRARDVTPPVFRKSA